jgi:hypothetical protein
MSDDEALVAAMAAELRRLPPCECVFQPASMLEFVALLQLALRYPHLEGSHREFAQRFLENARQYFASCPAVLEVMRRGDDPRERH